MDAGYRILPLVYDRWQGSYGKNFSELIFPRLLRTLRVHRISGPAMVDVACGTGTLALMMARRGWEVYGVDASEGMLACAASKVSRSGLPITFLRQDMRSLRLPRLVSLATSFFDSLNHLIAPEDFLSALRSVYAALSPGGWFVFDTNNERCFTQLWTKSETVTRREFIMTLANSYDRERRLATSEVTLTLKERGNHGQQVEMVRERYYPSAEIHAMLEEAGFVVRESDDFDFTESRGLGKIKTWWVVQKI
ncbi:MAG: class I SAM-dependent methyltransferase [Bacteroidota bacterium]